MCWKIVRTVPFFLLKIRIPLSPSRQWLGIPPLPLKVQATIFIHNGVMHQTAVGGTTELLYTAYTDKTGKQKIQNCAH
jgi:hypothetical protein